MCLTGDTCGREAPFRMANRAGGCELNVNELTVCIKYGVFNQRRSQSNVKC